MDLMPQKYPRVKANVWLFCMQVREVRIDGCDLVFLAKSKDGDHHQEMYVLTIYVVGIYNVYNILH
jgi:hypothetical protein